ncbi:MAG: ABC transporter ATP-binding protein [Anaerolineaceae bacterium]|nr:ABC transporter ATP-binding protein [Anaerolineaceae bacterium]
MTGTKENHVDSMIHIDHVRRVYRNRSDVEVIALDEITLNLDGGKFYSFKGRSGSGKTTLLNCISTLDKPTSGDVTIFGQTVTRLDVDEATRWRRDHVGFIFQTFGLIPTLSAYENIDLMLRLNGMGNRERHERVVECLDMVGLRQRVNHRPHELSGGQQQRIAIARALANRSKLLIADEPTGELDSSTACDMFELFQELVRDQGVTIVMATHDPLSDEYVDDVINLKDGRVITE